MDGSRYWLKMKTHYCWLLGFWLENLCGFNNTLYLNGAWELEKTLESPLDCKEIQAVHSKGGQSWVFIGRTDAEAETPILWPPHAKSWLIGKDPDAGSDWGQEEKGMTEDEMAGWHYWLDAHEFEWTPEVGDGQGGLECCDSWGRKQSDTTEQLNWTELRVNIIHYYFMYWVFDLYVNFAMQKTRVLKSSVYQSYIDIIKQQFQNLCLSLSPLYHPSSHYFCTIPTIFLLQQQKWQ